MADLSSPKTARSEDVELLMVKPEKKQEEVKLLETAGKSTNSSLILL